MSDLDRRDLIMLTTRGAETVNLQGVDLAGLRLSGIDLSGANLTGAKVQGAPWARAREEALAAARSQLASRNGGRCFPSCGRTPPRRRSGPALERRCGNRL